MLFVALSSAFLIYFLFYLLLTPFVKRSEQTKLRAEHIADMYNSSEKFNNDELKKPLVQRFLKPIFLKILGKLSEFTPKLNDNKLKKLLIMAGYTIQPATYNAIMFLVMIIFGAFFMLISFTLKFKVIIIILFIFLGMIFGLLLIRYILQINIRQRKEKMRRQMPALLDLLSVCVEAGLGFDTALMHVIKRLTGPLTDEFAITLQEISLGRARKDALKGLGERTGLEEMITFTSAVMQAEQQGISLKNVLNVQAGQIRIARRQSIEEKAMKAPVKIIIPLVIFIFPVILIILIGPAAMRIINVFAGF